MAVNNPWPMSLVHFQTPKEAIAKFRRLQSSIFISTIPSIDQRPPIYPCDRLETPCCHILVQKKETTALVANRAARWALFPNKYNYTLEYSKTSLHGNADALCRLLCGPNDFHGEENEADVDMFYAVKTVGSEFNPRDPGVLTKESSRDPVSHAVHIGGIAPHWGMQDLTGMVDFRKISSSSSAVHES